jgi:hypothetical protein
LDAFLVVTGILNFLEASSSKGSTRERETKSSECEVQVSDSSEQVANKNLLLLSQIVIRIYLHKETSFSVFERARSLKLLELLNTLINTIEDNTVILKKTTLQSVLTCLQVTQDKVRLLQSLSQLLNDELIDFKNKQPVKCSELVFVQHNPLYDDDDDDVFNQ